MDTVSPMQDARTRKTFTILLRALASVGQRATADALGVSETTISRMKSDGDLERFSRLLTVLGFKPVPVASKVVTPERAAEIEAEFANLRLWAEKGIRARPASILGSDLEADTGVHWEVGK